MDKYSVYLNENDSLILLNKMILQELKNIRLSIMEESSRICALLQQILITKTQTSCLSDDCIENQCVSEDEHLLIDHSDPANTVSTQNVFSDPSASIFGDLQRNLKPICLVPEVLQNKKSLLSDQSDHAVKSKPNKQKKKTKTKLCLICGTHKTTSNMAKHLRTHTGEKRHKCKKCGKLFIDSVKLRNHERIHTGEKPFQCNVCDKSFNLVETLRRHSFTHSSDKPYKCKYCFKTLNCKWLLQNHIRSHTRERPFQCKHCNKSYPTNGSLRQHMRTHDNAVEEKFECSICQKRFRSVADKKRHEVVHNTND